MKYKSVVGLMAAVAISSGSVAVGQVPRLVGDLAPGISPLERGSDPRNMVVIGDRLFFTGSGAGPGMTPEMIRVYSTLLDGSDLRDHGRIDTPEIGLTNVIRALASGSRYLVAIGTGADINVLFEFDAESTSPRELARFPSELGMRTFVGLETSTHRFVVFGGTRRIVLSAPRTNGAFTEIHNIRFISDSNQIDLPPATIWNDQLVFSGELSSRVNPWVSDGTAAGTHELISLNGTGSSSIQTMATLGSSLLIDCRSTASNNANAYHLVDPQTGSVTVLGTLAALGLQISSRPPVILGDRAVMFGSSVTAITDGTPAGTQRLMTAAGESTSFNSPPYIQIGNRLIYGNGARQLVSTDGTIAGTALLLDPAAIPANRQILTNQGDAPVAFAAGARTAIPVGPAPFSPSRLNYVILTDGTLAGTTITPSALATTVFLNNWYAPLPTGRAAFGAYSPFPNNSLDLGEIWLTSADGTSGALATDVIPRGPDGGIDSLGSFNGRPVIASGGRVYLIDPVSGEPTALPGPNTRQTRKPWAEIPGKGIIATKQTTSALWVTEGTAETTRPIEYDGGATGPSQPELLTTLGDYVYFTTTTAVWRTDGTGAGTTNLITYSNSSGFSDITTFAGSVWVGKREGTASRLLRITGTTVTDLGGFSNGIAFLGATANRLFFALTDSTRSAYSISPEGVILAGGPQAHRYALTPNGIVATEYDGRFLNQWNGITSSVRLSTGPVTSGITSGSFIERRLAVLPDRVVFVRRTNEEGYELWAYEFATNTAGMIRSFIPGPISSSISRMQRIGARAYFTVDAAGQGRELWVTDGTTIGTKMVAPVDPSPRGSVSIEVTGFEPKLDLFVPLANGLFLFGADDGLIGDEPWIISTCAADYNSDGVTDPDDMADYITGFFDGVHTTAEDLDGNGVVDPDDLADFIGVFFAGCE